MTALSWDLEANMAILASGPCPEPVPLCSLWKLKSQHFEVTCNLLMLSVLARRIFIVKLLENSIATTSLQQE